MAPIELPTSATRSMPRSPSQASAPATSSTSRRPKVEGEASDPPWPRKSRPSTPAVRRRNGPYSTRSGADEPDQPWSSRIAAKGSRLPVVGVLTGQPAGRQAEAVARAEPHDLATERVQGGRQRRLIRGRSRRIEQAARPVSRDRPHGDDRSDRRQRRGHGSPDHARPAVSDGSASNSNTSRLQVSIRSMTAATSAGSAKAPVSLSVSRMATGRPSASAT